MKVGLRPAASFSAFKQSAISTLRISLQRCPESAEAAVGLIYGERRDGERRGEEKRQQGAGAGARMTCMNGKMSRGKDGFAIHFEACTTSVGLT